MAVKKHVRLSFNVDEMFQTGIDRLKKVLEFRTGEGIEVTAVQGEKNGVTLAEGKAVIYYSKKHLFFRQQHLCSFQIKPPNRHF